MTFVELFEKRGLPEGVSLAQAQAADRAMRPGAKLGPAARRSLRRLFDKLGQDWRSRQREDFTMRDQYLREEWARTGRPGTGQPTRTQGGAGTAAPSRPTTGSDVGSHAGGGVALRKSSWSARDAPPEEFHQRLAQLGLDSSFHVTDNCTELARSTTKAPSLGIRIKQERLEREAEARRVRREKALAGSAIDGRTATPEQVRRRLDQLQIDPDLQRSIREQGKPLPLPDRGPDPMAASLEARRKALRRAKEAAKSKRPVDTRSMPDDVFQEYLRIRYGSWAGGL